MRRLALLTVVVGMAVTASAQQTTRWVARVSDGLWVLQGSDDPSKANTDPKHYIYVDVPGSTPDPRLERYSAGSPTKRRPATPAEIAAFDVSKLESTVVGNLDNERIFSAIVWTVIDTYSAPATSQKFAAARTKIIAAYKTQPWK